MAEPAWITQPAVGDTWDPTSTDDWQEIAGTPEQPGGGGSYARDDCSETLVGLIPQAKAYDARRKMLGYAYADDATPWELHRVNPLPHPDEGHLRAETVDLVAWNPMGTNTTPSPPPPSPPPPPPPPPTTYGAYRTSAVTGAFPRRMNYSRMMATVKFRPHPYSFITDAAMTVESVRLPEYYRNCTIFDSMDPMLEVLAGGSEPFLQWVDRPAGGALPLQSTSESLEGAQIAEYLSKAQIVIVWHAVPLEFIANQYLPSKIMACMGCVNYEDDWLSVQGDDGFGKGTLKLESPRMKTSTQCVLRTTNHLPSLCADIILPFSSQDPLMGDVVDSGGSPTTPSWGGFNALPYSKSGKFHAVGRKDDATKPYFPFRKFDNMFTHVGDTSLSVFP